VWTLLPSPIGELLLIGDGAALTSVWFPSGDGAPADPPPGAGERDDGDPVLAEAARQLTEYFAGRRTDFDLPLVTGGTPFQQRVWGALRDIPYGTTTSYGEIARRLGLHGGASRAVGLASGSNPISIVIPCHRVIGADGSLTGFGGGLDRKRFLLDLERGALF
jgi:methylated-DNA-[protein]-cysteine S-methyltransferase